MLPLVAEKSLHALALIRGVLTGDVDPATLPGFIKEKTDGGNRRQVALEIINGLGKMFAHILEVSAGSEEEIFNVVGGKELIEAMQKDGKLPGGIAAAPPEKEKGKFGFAQWTKE